MKLITTLFFCAIIGLASNTNDMIELLKTHIQNKEVDKVISLIKENPEILSLKDDNKTSGLMIIAYSGLDKAFEQASKNHTFLEGGFYATPIGGGNVTGQTAVVAPRPDVLPFLDASHISLSFPRPTRRYLQNNPGPKNDCPNTASFSI